MYYLTVCGCVCVFSSLPVPFHVVLVEVDISGCSVGLGCTFDFFIWCSGVLSCVVCLWIDKVCLSHVGGGII
jgi:hypothetical protein